MFCVAARTMGYRVWVLDPDPGSPAGSIADRHLKADYLDHAVLEDMAEHCAAITTEFENVPAESMEYLEKFCAVRPNAEAVRIAQDRIREKTFVQEHDLATAAFVAIYEDADIVAAIESLNAPLIMKTASLGYDGKGQLQVNTLAEARNAFEQLDNKACVLEELVDLEHEVSVILARSIDGQISIYPVGENRHVNGILDTTMVPAAIDASLGEQAIDMATRLADSMDYCGVLAVEFFCTRQGALLINEIATRPHNSGHYTVDACATSQFEQQVRMMCGLPPGDTLMLSPVVMTNLLGDIWKDGEPQWQHVLNESQAHLHLYGKKTARPGRKMGHINCLALDVEQALKTTAKIRKGLSI